MIFNMTGGGNPLNFKVVGGTTEPSNPKENTIWINTGTAISDYVFSAEQPAAASGRVWVLTGTASAAEFNALKKNGLQVYPISAKQYVSGKWVDKTAKSYQGGKWVDCLTYFYNKGNEYTSLTGGWEFVKGSTSGIHGSGTGAKNSDRITLSMGEMATGAAITSKTIDLTNFSTLEVNVTKLKSDYIVWFGVVTTNGDVVNNPVAQTEIIKGVVSLPIGDINGKYYIAVYLQTDPGHYGNFVTFDSVRAY